MFEVWGGELGVPLEEVIDADLSFADAEGMGSQLWPGVGFEGSRGGALRLFLGMDATGCECNTSLCSIALETIQNHFQTPNSPSSRSDPGISTILHRLERPSSSDIGSRRLPTFVCGDQLCPYLPWLS
jgi:hypothetical protein